MISVEDRGSLLLAETRHNVGTVVSRSGRHMVTVYDDEGPSIYEVAPRTFRLVSRDATLLDLSPDGTHALISFYRDARLRMLDMETGETRRVGPKRFLSSAARFSPDGRRVALTGTPNVFVETECEEAQSPCEPFFTANDVILWTLDPSTLKMRSILAAGSNGMSAPVWGPEGWLLIQSGSRSIAVPIDEPSRATVRFEGDFTQDWLEAQYLA